MIRRAALLAAILAVAALSLATAAPAGTTFATTTVVVDGITTGTVKLTTLSVVGFPSYATRAKVKNGAYFDLVPNTGSGADNVNIVDAPDGRQWTIVGGAGGVSNPVPNNQLANMANGTTKCRTTAGTGNPEDCTPTQERAVLGLSTVATTGAFSDTTGTVSIARGGTGQTAANSAFDALTVQGADIASASTTDLCAATGSYLRVTGTVTITAFGTCAAGIKRTVKFTGSGLTITHNATSLILPGATNITTTANDVHDFVSLGSGNWQCVDQPSTGGGSFLPLSGGTMAGAINDNGQAIQAIGFLSFNSEANNGNKTGASQAIAAFNTNPHLQKITLTGNVTSSTWTMMGAGNIGYSQLKVCQDGTGSRTLVWPTSPAPNWLAGGAPTLTTTASACDIIFFYYDGTNIYGWTGQAAVGGGSGITALTGDVTASGTGSVAATLAAGSASVLNSGTLNAARLPAFSGDVTTSAGSSVTTLANIPTATPAAGTIVHTNIATPASPAAGKVAVYSDSTDLRFHDKNASGTVATTVVADTGASNNFLTAISAAGVISKAQPAFSNLSGTAAINQGGTGQTTAGAAFDALTVQQGAIASAGTTSIASAGGHDVHITGTTTITSFGNCTAGVYRIVHFDGALTLTHNATSLILGPAANRTTAAGDSALFTCDSTNNWREAFYAYIQADPLNEFDAGNTGTALTIDWTKHRITKATLTGNVTFTFTAPTRATNIVLKMVEDGTGGRTITLPAAVKFSGGTTPTWTTTASAVNVLACYADTTNYYCSAYTQ